MQMNKKTKKNNIVLITGASGHIGSAIAEDFAKNNSDLILPNNILPGYDGLSINI